MPLPCSASEGALLLPHGHALRLPMVLLSLAVAGEQESIG